MRWWHNPAFKPAVQYTLIALAVVALSMITTELRSWHQVYGMSLFVATFACVAAWIGTSAGIFGVLISIPTLAFVELEGAGFSINRPDEASKLMVMVLGGAVSSVVVGSLRKRFDHAEVELAKRDIELRNTRTELHNSVTLLNELTHRVGNDLSTLSAIAGIKANQTGSETGASLLNRMRDRIHVFACLYRKLGSITSSNELSTKAFIESVCTDLARAHFELRPITLNLNVHEVQLPPRRAMLVGIMLNEAVSNIVKYAFPGDRAGIVDVTFNVNPHNTNSACLVVRDNGVGPDAAGKPSNGITSGVGSRIMEALCAQMRGGFSLTREGDHTVARMCFPLND